MQYFLFSIVGKTSLKLILRDQTYHLSIFRDFLLIERFLFFQKSAWFKKINELLLIRLPILLFSLQHDLIQQLIDTNITSDVIVFILDNIFTKRVDNLDLQTNQFLRIEEVITTCYMDYIVQLQSNVAVLSHILTVEMQHLLIFFNACSLLSQLFYLSNCHLGCYFQFIWFFRRRTQVNGDWIGIVILFIVLHLRRKVQGNLGGCISMFVMHLRWRSAVWSSFILICISSH